MLFTISKEWLRLARKRQLADTGGILIHRWQAILSISVVDHHLLWCIYCKVMMFHGGLSVKVGRHFWAFKDCKLIFLWALHLLVWGWGDLACKHINKGQQLVLLSLLSHCVTSDQRHKGYLFPWLGAGRGAVKAKPQFPHNNPKIPNIRNYLYQVRFMYSETFGLSTVFCTFGWAFLSKLFCRDWRTQEMQRNWRGQISPLGWVAAGRMTSNQRYIFVSYVLKIYSWNNS